MHFQIRCFSLINVCSPLNFTKCEGKQKAMLSLIYRKIPTQRPPPSKRPPPFSAPKVLQRGHISSCNRPERLFLGTCRLTLYEKCSVMVTFLFHQLSCQMSSRAIAHPLVSGALNAKRPWAIGRDFTVLVPERQSDTCVVCQKATCSRISLETLLRLSKMILKYKPSSKKQSLSRNSDQNGNDMKCEVRCKMYIKSYTAFCEKRQCILLYTKALILFH